MRAIASILLLTAGCASIPAPQSGLCRSEPLAAFVGREATAALGSEMLKASGATALRWAGPDVALTMDFRPERVTARYDGNQRIITASCG